MDTSPDGIYLVLLKPTRPDMPANPTASESDLVQAHFVYYQGLLEAGVLFHAGRSLEPPFVGIMLFEASSRAHAEQLVQDDPAVAGGVFQVTVQRYRVALSRD